MSEKKFSISLPQRCLLVSSLIFSASFNAYAANDSENTIFGDVTVAVGVRTWLNDWQSNGTEINSLNGTSTVTHANSSTVTGIIPFVLFKYRDFGFSASTLLNTDYSFNVNGTTVAKDSRKEYDLNFLYYILPSTSMSVGYKNIEWGFAKTNGLTTSISSSAPISDRFGLFGTVGIGRLNFVHTIIPGDKVADYTVAEAGISYSFGPIANFSKSNVITLGYRHQRIKVKDVVFSGKLFPEVNDVTSGMTFGFVAAF